MKKTISFFILLTFVINCVMPPQGFAQMLTAVGLMSQPGIPVMLSPVFTPAHLKGMVINPTDPFKFDFIVNRGDEALTDAQKQTEYSKLVKYFLAALAVPDTDQWVNLSPYENDRMIPDSFGLTEMGRDLLAQDYMLKQISASLTNPDTDLGKKFWDGVYAQAYEKYGTTDIPTDMINKVWITPDKAVVYEKENSVIVVDQHLKVMLESDYKAMKANIGDGNAADSDAVKISKQVMREIIIPAIEKEVNEGKNFAPLRQVYSGMLLATWYKVVLKESILGKLYADQGKVKGVDQDAKNNQQIYDQYVQAFEKGALNMIKEDVDRHTQKVIPRKYFSGGTENVFGKILQRVHELPLGKVRMVKVMKNGKEQVISDLDILSETLADAEIVAVKFVNTGANVDEFRKLMDGVPPEKVTKIGEKNVRVDAAENAPKDAAEVLRKLQAWIHRLDAILNAELEDSLVEITLEQIIIIDSEEERTAKRKPATLIDSEASQVVDQLVTLGRSRDKSLEERVDAALVLVEKFNRNDRVKIYKEYKIRYPQKASGVDFSIAFALLYNMDNMDNNDAAMRTPEKNEPPLLSKLISIFFDKNKTEEAKKSDTAEMVRSPLNTAQEWKEAYDFYMRNIVPGEFSSPDLAVVLNAVYRSKRQEKREKAREPAVLKNDVNKVVERMINLNDDHKKNWETQYEDVLDLISKYNKDDREEIRKAYVNKCKDEGKVPDFFISMAFKNAGTEDETRSPKATKGGIDFAQSNLDMQIKRDGAGVPLPISEQNLDNIRINGLVPVILNIRPGISGIYN